MTVSKRGHMRESGLIRLDEGNEAPPAAGDDRARPNTGGSGCFTPVDGVPDHSELEPDSRIPTVDAEIKRLLSSGRLKPVTFDAYKAPVATPIHDWNTATAMTCPGFFGPPEA